MSFRPFLCYGMEYFLYFWRGLLTKTMKLIVDSGSTKAQWKLQLPESGSRTLETVGINPVRDDAETVRKIVSVVAAELADGVDEVFFYGAGCVAPYAEVVHRSLQDAFLKAQIRVESDLLGVARALCGRHEGIACILGTGSNSCLYDGKRIVKNVSPLGWVLGDEGSGAVLGRLFVGDVLKRAYHRSLCTSFLKYHKLTQEEIIDRVYRQPQPNRFLASLVPFISHVQDDREVHAFLLREFRRFFHRNVQAYKRPDLPVNFVGGVAAAFEGILREAAEREKLIFGFVEQRPIQRIYDYHCSPE